MDESRRNIMYTQMRNLNSAKIDFFAELLSAISKTLYKSII